MKKELNKYTCTRCGIKFEIKHEVDESGAVCDKCFEIIKNSRTYEEYVNNRKQIF